MALYKTDADGKLVKVAGLGKTDDFLTTNTEQTVVAKKTIANSAQILNEDGHNILNQTPDIIQINNILKELWLYSNGRIKVNTNNEIAYLSDIPIKKEPTLVYNTSTASTGTYNFLEDVTNYNELCFAFYNNNGEYDTITIPVSEWLLKSSTYPLFMNSSSAANTRYILAYPSGNEAFVIKDRSNVTLRRIWGLK